MASDRKRGREPEISARKPLSFSRTIGAASSDLPQCDQAQSPATDLAAAAHFTKSLVSSIGRNFRSGDGERVHESRNFPPAEHPDAKVMEKMRAESLVALLLAKRSRTGSHGFGCLLLARSCRLGR